MTDKKTDLRKEAEKKVLHLPEYLEAMSPEETRQALHELRVHQIELEMQNDELRRMQTKYEASQARYFDLYDLAPVGYVTISEKGLILEANLTAATLLGVTKSDLTSQPFSRFIFKEDQDIYYRHRELLFDTGASQTCELRMLRMVKKDGAAFWARLEATAAPDDSGFPACRIVISDITERRVAEENLKKSEALLRSMIDSPLSIIIFSLDRNFRYLAFNSRHEQAMKAIWGADIRPGIHMLDVIGIESDKKKALLNFERVLAGESFTLIEEYGDDTLSRRFWENMYSPIYNENRQISGLTVCLIDVTVRKQAEEDLRNAHDLLEQRVVERTAEIKRQADLLRESEQRFRAIADYTYDWENWFGTDGKLLWVNNAVLGFTGYSTDECFAMTDFPFPIIDKADREMMRQHKATAIQGSMGSNIEFRLQCKDGRLKWAEMSWRQIYDPKGVNMGYRSSVRDVSERKQKEKELQNALQAAEVANRAKSEFLANMSHEIRTPMSGVLGMTGLLLETPLTDKQRRYAKNIKTSGESLLALLNDILDFSKVEAGKVSLEHIPFSMSEVIGNVVNIFGIQAAEKKIEFHIAIDPELPAAILGDPQRLVQVINNLMGNAVKFTAAGEIQLTIKVRRQTSTNILLEISVRDTGIGMTEEDMGRMFKAFSQADASTTRRFGGTGLGLAISWQLVELMGGTIQVESAPGKGSVFTVLLTFPIAPESGDHNLRKRPEMSPISGDRFNVRPPRARFTDVRALVAEDHVINREIIVELLRQVGIEADIATNGREAVEMVQVRDYDVVFMDIQMPEMDGITATREIRNLGREGVDRLPILAMTAHALIGDREKSLAAGMNEHLTKPINHKALVAALRRWLPSDKYAADEPDISTKPLIIPTLPTPALDMKEGLERLGGNGELYLKLLKDFIAQFEETPLHLLQELRADRRDEAVHLVHAIRGIAGNLGGKELEAAAAELEKACQAAGKGVPFALGEPLRVFIDRHGALLTAIGNVLVQQPVVAPVKPEGKQGDAAELRPLLERLKRALASEEPRPCKEILGILLQRRWSESHTIVLAELNRLVQRYRLAEAFSLLDKEFNDVFRKSEERDGD